MGTGASLFIFLVENSMEYLKNLDKDKAYIREALYLPKSKINVNSLISLLTFEGNEKIMLHYHELPDHLIVPRSLVEFNRLRTSFTVIDLRPKKYNLIEIKSNIVLKDDLQKNSCKAMRSKEGMIIVPCGSGKTVMGLYEVVQRKVPTLIITNTEQLLSQWQDEISRFITVKSVGRIQAERFDWEHPLVLATVQTLSNRRDTISEQIRKYFGLIIWDEVDEMTTPIYSNTADIFMGARIGLSATWNRKDGNERIFKYHIGPVLYRDDTFVAKPKVYFIFSNTFIPMQLYTNMYSLNTGYGKLYTLLSEDTEREKLIINLLKQKQAEGRKILVLGERKEQLRRLHKIFKGSGLCIFEVDIEDRKKMLKNCDIIFAIRRLSKRGLNQIDLDTLVILYPMSDPSGIRQACGRIVRECSTKKNPEVYVIKDIRIPPLVDTCNKLEKVVTEWEFETCNIPIIKEKKNVDES